jgi:hypothetical protein
VKRSGRYEPVWVVIHMCVEAMLGISLSLSQTSKNDMSFSLSLMFSLQQNWRRGKKGFCLEVRGVGGEGRCRGQGGELTQTMYAYMNK